MASRFVRFVPSAVHRSPWPALLPAALFALACDKPAPTPAPVATGSGAVASAKAPASTAAPAVPAMTGKPSASPDSISAGFTSTCAHFPDGSAMCWGRVGTWIDDDKPVWVQGLRGSKNITVSGSPIWAVMQDGTLTCWADDRADRGCGWGSAVVGKPRIHDLSGIAEIASAKDHGCARLTSGNVACWGKNGLGQVGVGKTDANDVAPRDTVTTEAIGIAVAEGRSCAVKKDGTVRCWGRHFGKDAVDSSKPPPTEGPHDDKPVQVPGLSGIEQVGVGDEHACARGADGTVKCWGVNNEGQLGDGARAGRLAPSPVRGLTDAVDLAVGSAHACALTRSGKVKCWGRNWHGEIGDGSTVSRNVPVDVKGIAPATQIAAGGGHSCALEKTGKMRCWGANREGQLGDATRGGTGSATTVAFLASTGGGKRGRLNKEKSFLPVTQLGAAPLTDNKADQVGAD